MTLSVVMALPLPFSVAFSRVSSAERSILVSVALALPNREFSVRHPYVRTTWKSTSVTTTKTRCTEAFAVSWSSPYPARRGNARSELSWGTQAAGNYFRPQTTFLELSRVDSKNRQHGTPFQNLADWVRAWPGRYVLRD